MGFLSGTVFWLPPLGKICKNQNIATCDGQQLSYQKMRFTYNGTYDRLSVFIL